MMYGWIIGATVFFVLIRVLGRGYRFQINTGTPTGSTTASPMETLKNRYAKRENDTAEFEKKKIELEKTN